MLAGYVGIAGGLFAGALACAAAAVFLFSLSTTSTSAPDEVFCFWSSWRWLCFLGLAFLLGLCWGVQGAQGAYPVFQAAPAAQRSTHGHGDGLEAWRAHADTRHPLGRHRSRVPAPVRGSPRVVDEGRHAGAR